MSNIIITFLSHYDAIEFFTQHQNNFEEINVLPVPRKISSSCGSCVKLIGNVEAINFDLVESFEAVYVVNDNEYVRVMTSE